MERVVKGIWIPIEIWEDDILSLQEKCLLAEIDSLDGEDGCYASNDRLAKYLNLSKDRISKLISSLQKKGLITVKLIYKAGTKEVQKRVVKVVKTPIGKNNYTLSAKTTIPIVKNNSYPIGENAEDSNTVINNTIEKGNALSFLQKNSFSVYESLMMKYQSKIIEFNKAKEQFNLQYDVEGRVYDVKTINARAQLYFNRWVENQAKYNQPTNQTDQQQQGYRKNTF